MVSKSGSLDFSHRNLFTHSKLDSRFQVNFKHTAKLLPRVFLPLVNCRFS